METGLYNNKIQYIYLLFFQKKYIFNPSMNNKHKQCSKFSCETKLQEEQMIHKLHKKWVKNI